MKTTRNVAKVSAQMIRAAVKDVHESTDGLLMPKGPRRAQYDNAMKVILGVAAELEQYAGAFDEGVQV
jgi:hypothetical protein